MVGSKVPEQDEVWATMMDLKEVVQVVLSPSFTEESIRYLQTKIKEHRQALKQCFLILSSNPSIITLNIILS